MVRDAQPTANICFLRVRVDQLVFPRHHRPPPLYGRGLHKELRNDGGGSCSPLRTRRTNTQSSQGNQQLSTATSPHAWGRCRHAYSRQPRHSTNTLGCSTPSLKLDLRAKLATDVGFKSKRVGCHQSLCSSHLDSISLSA